MKVVGWLWGLCEKNFVTLQGETCDAHIIYCGRGDAGGGDE